MKIQYPLLGLLASFLTYQVSRVGGESSALDVVKKRMNAHNDHDLEAFLDMYSDEIQIYDYPDVPIGKKGKVHIRSIFAPLFKDGAVSVVIHQQIEQGNYVVNHETVTRHGKKIKYVSIYEVVDGLITSVRFIRE